MKISNYSQQNRVIFIPLGSGHRTASKNQHLLGKPETIEPHLPDFLVHSRYIYICGKRLNISTFRSKIAFISTRLPHLLNDRKYGIKEFLELRMILTSVGKKKFLELIVRLSSNFGEYIQTFSVSIMSSNFPMCARLRSQRYGIFLTRQRKLHFFVKLLHAA